MADPTTEDLVQAARGYETLFVPALFGAWTKHMIVAAEIDPQAHVLDLACGTGVLARDLRKSMGDQGRVVGVDPAPGMMAVARELAPDIEWQSATAEEMGFSDASFDVVLSQFGMMFFQDQNAAMQNVSRVLKPGGHCVVSVWNSLSANPAYGALVALIESEVGKDAAQAVALPFSLGNANKVTGIMADAGLSDIRVATLAETARFPNIRTMVEAELRGWLPLFDIHLDETHIASVLESAERDLAAFADQDGAAVFTASAHILAARKPG